MKVSQRRLQKLLEPIGFITRRVGRHDLGFIRPDVLSDLYLLIELSFAGKKNEAVAGYVFISVTRWICIKGISEGNLLLNVASDKERGHTIVETTSQAKEWEYLLARNAPTAVEALAREHGQSLLDRSAHARQRAALHIQRLDRTEPLYAQIIKFDVNLINAAQRLAEWPGVMQVYDAEEIYLLASAMVLSGDEEFSYWGQDPLHNDDLMWQVQLVADEILSWERGQVLSH
ncbi:MAG: hypothetical protein ACKVT0_11875 [Planctomycetaceae bacterium]